MQMFLLFVLSLLFACTHDAEVPKAVTEPSVTVPPTAEKSKPDSSPAELPPAEGEAAPLTQLPPAAKVYPCLSQEELGLRFPQFFESAQIVVTRVANPCLTQLEEQNYKEEVVYMAMGIPCTAGGKIDVTGYVANPKMVAFPLNNSCPMRPGNEQEVSAVVKPLLGIESPTRLVAFYPLAIQYWELVDMPDADLGSTVELRSEQSLSAGWKAYFAKGQPVNVTLYGRENAWVKQQDLYKVSAQLFKDNEKSFRVHVTHVEILDQAGIAEAVTQCSNKVSIGDCGRVFSP